MVPAPATVAIENVVFPAIVKLLPERIDKMPEPVIVPLKDILDTAKVVPLGIDIVPVNVPVPVKLLAAFERYIISVPVEVYVP